LSKVRFDLIAFCARAPGHSSWSDWFPVGFIFPSCFDRRNQTSHFLKKKTFSSKSASLPELKGTTGLGLANFGEKTCF